MRSIPRALLALLMMAVPLSWGVPAALGASSKAAASDGGVVRAWNELAFQQVRDSNSSDGQAARLYAMVDAAMFDAVNGTAAVGPPRRAAIVTAPRRVAADPVAAAAGAAHDVLAALYPGGLSAYDTQLASDLGSEPSATRVQRGRDWGAQVASGVLSARSDDGSQGNEIQPGGSGFGAFTASWAPQYRHLRPFVISDPERYLSTGTPNVLSGEYVAAYNEVKTLGGAVPADDAALATYRFWSLGSRTDQPPGGWLQVADAVSDSRHLSLADTARLFALQSIAMADTVAPTFETKYRFHTWRPTTAIRALDDGNPDTVQDPTWSPRAGTIGGTPEHWSGHSTFSVAAATALAGFFCDDNLPFSLHTDGQAETRSYASFSAAAVEAGRSRILGGLHFSYSDTTGRAAGRAIANEVLASALLREHGPTHRGSCPR